MSGCTASQILRREIFILGEAGDLVRFGSGGMVGEGDEGGGSRERAGWRERGEGGKGEN